jgi:hypothetical protein
MLKKEKIFDPFFNEKGLGSSNGIAQGFVERLRKAPFKNLG